MMWFFLFTMMAWAEAPADEPCPEATLQGAVPGPGAEDVPVNTKMFVYLDGACGSENFSARLSGPLGLVFETTFRMTTVDVTSLPLDAELQPNSNYQLELQGAEVGEYFEVFFQTAEHAIAEWTSPEVRLESPIVEAMERGAAGEVQVDVEFAVPGGFASLRGIPGVNPRYVYRVFNEQSLPYTQRFELDLNGDYCMAATEYSYAGVEQSEFVCIEDPVIAPLQDHPLPPDDEVDDDDDRDDDGNGCATVPAMTFGGLIALPLMLLGMRRRR